MTTQSARSGEWGGPIPDHISVIGIDTEELHH